jgi:L-tartrate/succinate antiporter
MSVSTSDETKAEVSVSNSTKGQIAPEALKPPAAQRPVLLRWLVPLGLGVLVWLLPRPEGLTPNAWHYFAVFVFTIVGLITEPLPGTAMGLLGICIVAVLVLVGKTPTESMRWALSGFNNDVVWLIFTATTFALGYEATGLGRRIALLLVKALGKRTLGLGYAIALADLVLAPFMPSNTARSAGTIYPVIKNIPPLYGSSSTENPRAIGAYLFWTAFATTCITSSMFATAMAPNMLTMEIAWKIAHVEITWTSWMMGFLPIGLGLLLVVPLVTYLLYPPAIKRGDRVADWAAGELVAMGGISRRELTMALLAVAALVCWIVGGKFIAAVTVSLAVLALMVLTRVVSWNDILNNRQGWNVLVWMATLVAMADGLSRVGFLDWFAKRIAGKLAGLPVTATVVGIIALYFLVHYLFASTTAHATAVLPAFLATVLAVNGLPVKSVVFVLVYSLGLMGVLTPYGTGPAPIWYSTGYVSTKDFWKLGFIMGMMYLVVLLVLGLPYALHYTR